MRELLYHALLPFGTALSLSGLHALGRAVGTLMWMLLPGRRQETIQTMASHLGLDKTEAIRLAHASFQHSASSFLEIFHTRAADLRFLHDRLEIDNPAVMDKLLTTTRPVVATTAHIGSWELLGGLMGAFPGRSGCHVVARLPKDKALGEMMMHMRTKPGVRVLLHRDAARETMAYLRAGGLSAFLVDHNCKRAEAEFLPFLGEIAAVNKGPALLALRAKALVWPGFMVRLPGGRLRFVVREPLDTATLEGSREERVREICRFYTAAVEDVVREYPEQWFWMHRRWKTRP